MTYHSKNLVCISSIHYKKIIGKRLKNNINKDHKLTKGFMLRRICFVIGSRANYSSIVSYIRC